MSMRRALGWLLLDTNRSDLCVFNAGYTATVNGARVQVTPWDYTFPDNLPQTCSTLLRQNVTSGEVIRLEAPCQVDAGMCQDFVDECVPPGTYRYGCEIPFKNTGAYCSIQFYTEVTVTGGSQADCLSDGSQPAPVSPEVVPWPSGCQYVYRYLGTADDPGQCRPHDGAVIDTILADQYQPSDGEPLDNADASSPLEADARDGLEVLVSGQGAAEDGGDEWMLIDAATLPPADGLDEPPVECCRDTAAALDVQEPLATPDAFTSLPPSPGHATLRNGGACECGLGDQQSTNGVEPLTWIALGLVCLWRCGEKRLRKKRQPRGHRAERAQASTR